MTTTYGTIPSSANPKHTSPSEERIEATLGIRHSYKTMFNFSSFAIPAGAAAAVSRIRINLHFFRRNYADIVFFCLISWFPISLLAAAIAEQLFEYFVRSGKTAVIFGRPIDDWAVLMAMWVSTEVTLHLLLLLVMVNLATVKVNSTAAILVVLVVAMAVATHSALRKTEDLLSEEEEEEAQGTLMRNVAASLPAALLVMGSCMAKIYLLMSEKDN